MSILTRVKKLEDKWPEPQPEPDYEAAWLPVFEKMGLPADTEVPQHLPLVVGLKGAEGPPGMYLVSFNGTMHGFAPEVSTGAD